jgi:hypothetical protein
MEAVNTIETLVNFYETAGRNIPEDSYFYSRRTKSPNLKKNLLETFFPNACYMNVEKRRAVTSLNKPRQPYSHLPKSSIQNPF